MQIRGFEKSRFVFQEKSDCFHNFAISIHKVSVARMLSRNGFIERFSADRKKLIETIKEQIEKVVFEKIESFYQSESLKYANTDNFRVSSLG